MYHCPWRASSVSSSSVSIAVMDTFASAALRSLPVDQGVVVDEDQRTPPECAQPIRDDPEAPRKGAVVIAACVGRNAALRSGRRLTASAGRVGAGADDDRARTLDGPAR